MESDTHNMMEFTQLYMEYKREEQERKCEQVRENCYSDDENYCFYKAGMDECIEDENGGGGNEDMERFIECQVNDLIPLKAVDTLFNNSV